MGILQQISGSPIFSWVILPLLIFISRILDVSLGTIRIIFVSRGKKLLAPILGFFEVSIWLLAISQIMQQLDNIACFLAYAGGFAMGNLIGIIIEEKLAMGILIIRIFIINDESEIKEKLYKAGFGVTSIDAHGMNGDVKIIYTLIKRKSLEKAVAIIEECQSRAFYSIEEAKSVKLGTFSSDDSPSLWPFHFKKKKRILRQGK